MDARGGLGQHTSFHFAATRSNFDVVFLLDNYGADIFQKNREQKTCYNQVNNNLLMLKLVKKLERKQFLNRHLGQISNIQPSECILMT